MGYLQREINLWNQYQDLCQYTWEGGLVNKKESSSIISTLIVINISEVQQPVTGGQDFRLPMTPCYWDTVVFRLRSGDTLVL